MQLEKKSFFVGGFHVVFLTRFGNKTKVMAAKGDKIADWQP